MLNKLLLRNSRMIVVILLAALVVTPASRAKSAPPQQGMAPYLTPQTVAHIEEGRTINFVCLGKGSPTVILSAGLGHWSWWWVSVQTPLAARTRVCAWDRAGYGFSGASPEPQDIVHTTQDLEQALKNAAIQGPYVMVGHSLGAFETVRFADLHPQSVVGMVLVDPSIPDQTAIQKRTAPQFEAVLRTLEDRAVTERQNCAAELRDSTLESGTPRFKQCTVPPNVPAIFPDLKAAIARLNAVPARLLTQASTEKEHITGNSSREATNAQRHYGAMPLIVLTAGGEEASILSSLSALPSGTPGASTPTQLAQLREQIARFVREVWGTAHEAYAALSTRGRHQLVPDSGHNMIVEKPAAVVSAVIEVLNESQARPPDR